MTSHYSSPFETLLKPGSSDQSPIATTRVLIIGSGYGGSVAAYRLTCGHSTPNKHDVMVLERGREYALGEFPTEFADLPAYIQLKRSNRRSTGDSEDALFDIRMGTGVDVLVGSGLGGTSLINANVAIRPDLPAMINKRWPSEFNTSPVQAQLTAAFDQVTKWLGVVNNTSDPDGSDRQKLRDLKKFKAFAHYAKALGKTAEPAPITVALHDKYSHSNVKQPACTLCGNCVTGCNVGAKNTLTTNLIPAATACGAEFFTGALVLSIKPITVQGSSTERWRVNVVPTSRATRARFGQTYFIEADIVILAAGTLGSTEILKRSSELGYLNCSEQLGMGFSTNGDGIAMSYAEREAVNPLGRTDYEHPLVAPGPTISAMMHGMASAQQPFLLEDAAVPASLTRLFGEVITTAAQFGRLGDNLLPGWFKQPGNQLADPLTVQEGALEHSQVFLIMSPDKQDTAPAGTLEYQYIKGAANAAEARIVPTWPAPVRDKSHDSAATDDPLASIDATLAKLDRRAGLHDGQYVRNPLWKLLPDSATDVMSGTFPGGRLISVHPLGGCAMGDSVLSGVVNHEGKVFKKNGQPAETYQGLYVMDGSILPTALGVNPFLTIAALAWRACEPLTQNSQEIFQPSEPARMPVKRLPEPNIGGIVIRERLIGQLHANEQQQQQLLSTFSHCQSTVRRLMDTDGAILAIETNATSTAAILSDTSPITLSARLYFNPFDAESTRRRHSYGIATKHLTSKELIADGTGTITIMQAEAPVSTKELLKRRRAALKAYFRRRESPWYVNLAITLADHFFKDPVGDTRPGKGIVERAKSFLRIAEMHATYRQFRYDIKLTTRDGQPTTVHIGGTKTIAWAEGKPQLWESFVKLNPTVNVHPLDVNAELYVDMHHLVGDGLFRIDSPRNVPAQLLDCMSFVTRLARSTLQSSFWAFGAPAYPKKPLQPKPLVPKSIGGHTVQTFELSIPKLPTKLKLHRYGKGKGQPVLLLHGLAQGSLIFAHPKLKISMAEYLLNKGYDVWLFDYRLSNVYSSADLPYGEWTIDDIGLQDIPAAVDHIFGHYNDKHKIHVFAHCVGAMAIAMAVLKGVVARDHIASIALNAIHPWIVGSPYNRVRAKLGVVLRDFIGDQYLDPVIKPETETDATQSLLDRLGFSLARLNEDSDRHLHDENFSENAICDRMTFLYGRMWQHAKSKSIHAYWKDLVGRAPGSVYRHLYYCLSRGRVVNAEGENIYLLEEKLKNWMGIRTLFMHGEASEVFNPQSATESAVRLKKVLTELARVPGNENILTPVCLKRIPHYGHMDVILADSADQESFPYLHDFFAGHFDDEHQPSSKLPLDPIDDRDATELQADSNLVCGPILRSATIVDGKLRCRYWMELPTLNTSPVQGIAFQVPPTQFERMHTPVDPNHTDFDWSRYWWVDADYALDSNFSAAQIKAVIGGSGTSLTTPPMLLANLNVLLSQLVMTTKAAATTNPCPDWKTRLVDRTINHSVDDFHFIVGSCRYPGTVFDAELSDGIHAGMQTLLQRESCDLLFLIGDQIYADASAGLFDPISWKDRYIERYKTAFTSPLARSVLNMLPTHFAVDDHEIADNYTGVPTPPGPSLNTEDAYSNNIKSGEINQQQLEHATLAATAYMSGMRHLKPFGNQPGQPDLFWYALDYPTEVCCPCFVMDTRFKRKRATDADVARMIDASQMTALLNWLTELAHDKTTPKFIVSGSALVPLVRDYESAATWMREDGFAGYPEQLDQIISCIVEQQIQQVVFVGGDLHLSCTAHMTLSKRGRQSVSALQIVSSGLYAPLPFANLNPADVRWKGEPGASAELLLPTSSIYYDPKLLASGQPHFVKVGATPVNSRWLIRAQAYDQGATLLNQTEYEL